MASADFPSHDLTAMLAARATAVGGQLFWSIDPVNGSDRNLGYGATMAAADLVPLKTLREADLRQFGSAHRAQPVFHLLNDVPLSDSTVMHNVRSANGLGFPTMIGTKTQIGGDYTVTSFVVASATVGTGGSGYLVNATGIGDAGNVNMLLETTDATIAAWIQSAPSANQVRIDTPSNGNVLAGTPGVFASLSGKTVRVYQVTRLPVYPFAQGAGFSALAYSRFGFGYAAQFDQAQLGTSSPFVSRCKTEGAWMAGGDAGSWNACLFTNDGITPTTLSRHSAFVNFCGVRGTGAVSLLLQGGTSMICQGAGTEQAALDVQNATVQLEDATLGAGIWSLSAFGCTGPVLQVNTNGRLQQGAGKIYGTGNTSYLIDGPSGPSTSGQLNTAGINFATTKPKLGLIGGVETDLPTTFLTTAP